VFTESPEVTLFANGFHGVTGFVEVVFLGGLFLGVCRVFISAPSDDSPLV
jgi:hypothetical protein